MSLLIWKWNEWKQKSPAEAGLLSSTGELLLGADDFDINATVRLQTGDNLGALRSFALAGLGYWLLAAFAFNTNFPMALLLSFSIGFGFMIQANSMNSLLQLKVQDNMRGRVMGLYTLCFFGLTPFGSLAAGTIAEYIPLNLTVALTALIMLIGSLLILWRIPEIRKINA